MSLWHPHFTRAGGPPGFSSLFRMLDDFDKYAQQQLGTVAGATTTFSPKFDVAEHDKEYLLQGELPGVSPENVEIEFTDPQTLVVRGHAERQRTEGDLSLLEAPEPQKRIESAEGGREGKKEAAAEAKPREEGARGAPRYWLSERSYGEFSRVFSFPGPVDQDNVKAKFKDGILDIRVPKAEKRGAKRITIS
ncbi:hypothetical protein VTK56DRAFT_10128 [Thermocarpiscus australiensis]